MFIDNNYNKLFNSQEIKKLVTKQNYEVTILAISSPIKQFSHVKSVVLDKKNHG